MRKAAASLILALIAFALSSALISRLASPRDRGGLSYKLHYFEEHKDSFDAVFFGSSMVMRGVMPRVFDAALRDRGHEIRSFSFALGGMTPHEANAVIREVLAMQPRRLRYVFVELMGWSPTLLPNEFTGRTIAWHDWAETASVLRTVSLVGEPFGSRIELAWMHVLHFGARLLPVGRLSREGVREEPEQLVGRFESTEVLNRHAGFLPYPERALERAAAYPRRLRFLRDLEGYQEAVAELRSRPGLGTEQSGSIIHYNLAALRAQVETIRRAGAVPVHLVMPTSVYSAERRAVSMSGLAPTTLAFDDPAAYPELYDPANRYDAHHLLTKGARRFSKVLAARVAHEVIDPAASRPPAPTR